MVSAYVKFHRNKHRIVRVSDFKLDISDKFEDCLSHLLLAVTRSAYKGIYNHLRDEGGPQPCAKSLRFDPTFVKRNCHLA